MNGLLKTAQGKWQSLLQPSIGSTPTPLNTLSSLNINSQGEYGRKVGEMDKCQLNGLNPFIHIKTSIDNLSKIQYEDQEFNHTTLTTCLATLTSTASTCCPSETYQYSQST